MKNDFSEIVRQHSGRYPKMMPQDYGKLAYQSEFGPEHMVADKEQVLHYLRKEQKEAAVTEADCRYEFIGNGLCRFHMSRADDDSAATLLSELFIHTAKEHTGTYEGLNERLEYLRKLPVYGMEDWLLRYRAEGCPPVHHSADFRDAYHPHYRLLLTDYAVYFQVLAAVHKLISKGKSVIVAIDGRCGSGKSGLAQVIQRVFPCNVFHMDDYYLPLEKRKENWEEICGGNMDFERFKTEVLAPSVHGEAVMYRPYDCRSATYGSCKKMQHCILTVVEGSYCGHPLLTDAYDMRIFLSCSKDVQTRRLKEREGEYYAVFAQRWMPMEESYLKSCNIQQNSHIVLDTGDFF